jgi:N-acetylglucosaminyl-diphospho-decaprenol L-rhamnosyltransferase
VNAPSDPGNRAPLPGPTPDGSVAGVVVNYNAKDYLVTCVGSLLREGVSPVVVVDNGSGDGSELALLQRYPEARWVPSGANLGYGRAVNIGVAMVGAGRLLVCNADVVVGPGAVTTLAQFLDDRPRVALVGPRIVDVNGELYPSARRFPDLVESFGHGILGQFWPGNPFSRRYRMTEWDHATAREVDWISGACFLARREAWDAVGGFDRDFFMYMEDVDLCWRLGEAGWTVAYEPAAPVVHVQGVSADRHPYRMLFAHHVSLWRFARRTTTGWRRWSLALVLPGLVLRLGLTAARRALSGVMAGAPGRRSAASAADG